MPPERCCSFYQAPAQSDAMPRCWGCATSDGYRADPGRPERAAVATSAEVTPLRWRRDFRRRAGILGSLSEGRGPGVGSSPSPQPLSKPVLTTECCKPIASRHALCFPKERPRPSRPRPPGSPAASPGERSPFAHACRLVAPPNAQFARAYLAHRPKRSWAAHPGASFFALGRRQGRGR